MLNIIAGILSLNQYLETLKDPNHGRLERCPCCGKASPWRHGHYSRKADRSGSGEASFNPIPVQRFFCPGCRKTSSVLPECISPRRWYLWDVQQIALLLLLAGDSLNATAKTIMPSRHTIKRWLTRFKEQFCLHKDVLSNLFVGLGRVISFIDFWKEFLRDYLLSTAMRLFHAAGVHIP